ncbi:MAG: hypothetical protein ACR2GH_23265, partial [Pseudonocardia sp.]
FATWHVFRRARQRARRRPTTRSAATWARTQTLLALQLLSWLDEHGKDLGTATQADLDAWLDEGRDYRHLVRGFITWAVSRHLCADRRVPTRHRSDPADIVAEADWWALLTRCLRDADLPLDVRAAGALVLLYGRTLTTIAALTAADIHQRNDETYLHFREQDVPLDIRELYRAAFAAVLGATEADLGFRPRRAAAPPPPALTAAALTENGDPAADGDAFDRLATAIARRADTGVIEHLAAVLAVQRQLEDVAGTRRVLPAVLAEIELIERLAPDVRGPVRAGPIGLAAEYRQFAGWMGEDTGDHAAALAHYDRAMDAAQETGDANMITSVLSLKRPPGVVGGRRGPRGRARGGRSARRRPGRPGVLALIAQQQARGHALDGGRCRGRPVARPHRGAHRRRVRAP